MHVLGHRGGHDLLWCQPDALVDDLEPRVARPHRHLLGAVGVPVQPRLAHEEAQVRAELVAGAPHRVPDVGQLTAPVGDPAVLSGRHTVRTARHRRGGDARVRAVLAEDLPQRVGPLPRGDAGPGALDGRGHQVGRGGCVGAQPLQCVPGRRTSVRVSVALVPPAAHRLDGSLLHVGVGHVDGRVEVRRERAGLGTLEAVDADDLVDARLDAPPALGVRGDERGLEVAGLHRLDDATHRLDPSHLLLGPGDQLGDPGLDHGGAGKDVLVLEQVRLVGQHLLDAQGPLLVPGPR